MPTSGTYMNERRGTLFRELMGQRISGFSWGMNETPFVPPPVLSAKVCPRLTQSGDRPRAVRIGPTSFHRRLPNPRL